MKNFVCIILCSSLLFFACSKSDSTPSNTIITSDSSQYNGRLIITTLDFANSGKLYGSDVSIYANYEDIKHKINLNNIKCASNSTDADFGYLLQGNYYVVSNNNTKTDTSLVQVLGQKTIKRSVFLK